MIKFRTIAHLLQIFVLPDIEKRIKNGSIKESDLPIELYQFRAIQRKLLDGKPSSIVELNQEVKILAQIKRKKKIEPGQPVTINDIYPEECYISPPVYDGKQAAYFLCQSLLFDYFLFFDCRPNLPDVTEKELAESKSRYPILDFINAKNFRKTVKPEEKIKNLADNNWPPAPGYYPQVLLAIHKDPSLVSKRSLLDVVAESYKRTYWDGRTSFWQDSNFFPKRLPYLKRAIDAHFDKDYASSIYVLVPQFEGIIKDYLASSGITPSGGFKDYVEDLRKLAFSRKILMFPKDVIETIFHYLKNGSFWNKNSDEVSDPQREINRHGIVHGEFTEFECEEISLKYLILLDSLSFILLHDKILTRNI